MQGELREEFINLIKIYYAVITRKLWNRKRTFTLK